LKERNILPTFEDSGIDTVVFAMDDNLYNAAVGMATQLRQAGQRVDVVLESKKPKWVFKHADRIGAKYCLIVGADEYAKGEVAMKDLQDGEQVAIKIDSLAEWAASKKQ
jgi:histidyl-tRNA synthetase